MKLQGAKVALAKSVVNINRLKKETVPLGNGKDKNMERKRGTICQQCRKGNIKVY